MPYVYSDLPAYPVLSDVWDELKNEKRPIVVYGMGNGADKLFSRFYEYGITVSDVFASDGFVRGHSYRGYRVKSFSEIKEQYTDFVIVLSFASNREEVISMLCEIDGKYDMYAPDMPVAGVDEYFDREFYNKHYSEINSAYNSLADEESKAIFSSVVNYKLSGRIKYLLTTYSERDEIYSLISQNKVETIIDAGAYNGDTAREAKAYLNGLKRIYAIEPDAKTFKKLAKYSEAETEIEVIPINAAAWCDNVEGTFLGSGNRNSTAVATASYEHTAQQVNMLAIDSIQGGKIDYIKYDVEGAETEALMGSENTIKTYFPALLVSLYHRSRDIFSLVNYVGENYPEYKLYLRRLKCIPAWEIDLICVKN